MYSIVKKLIIVLIICSFWASGLFAQKIREVSLRFVQQENLVRIVMESDDEMIKNSRTITSLSSLKVEFPFEFEIKKQKDFSFETAKKERWLLVNLKDIADVRTYKLTSPARVVFELKTVQKKQPEIQKPETQPNTQKSPAVSQQPVQKPNQEPVKPVEKPHTVKTVVIDAGHGGFEFGTSTMEIKEKDVNLNIAKDLANAMSKKGLKVLLTRKADQSLSINDRINLANRNKPDLFLSLHSSMSDKFVIYVPVNEDLISDPEIKPYSLSEKQNKHSESSKKLAKVLAESLKNDFKTDVISREMPLPVINSIDAPAVLIEFPSLLSVVYDQKMRDRVVNSILKGIIAYEQ